MPTTLNIRRPGTTTPPPTRLRRPSRRADPPGPTSRLPREYNRPGPGWKPGHYDGPTNATERRHEARFLATGGDLIPPIYRRQPGSCLILLYKAQALDIPVATTAENLHWNPAVGKGAMSAQLMAALLRRHGYDYQATVETDQAVTMKFYRRTDGRRRLLGTTTWTMLEAIGAGLAWRDLWQNYPTDMLWARCLMRGARRYASDVGTGLAYTPEELTDMAPAADTITVHPDVETLLNEATTDGVTAEQIKNDIARRARAAKLLGADIGDGTTLGYQLGILYGEARAREVDATQAALTPASDDAGPDDRVTGDGPLNCGCDSAAYFRAGGQHQPAVCRG